MDFIDLLILFLIIVIVLLIARKVFCRGISQIVVGGNGKEFKKLDRKLMPILTPEFNLREISKQCILLEEHLNQLNKLCLDCCNKHMITVEGLLEEAISLDKDQKMTKYLQELFQQWVKIEMDYINKKTNFIETAQKIRQFRKPLLDKHFRDIGNYKI